MKLRYLGTAAAEGFPALFCSCEKCKTARAKGNKNIRTRSQAAVDGRLLVDLPCDTLWHMTANGMDVLDFTTLLITHVHSDHFYPSELSWLQRGYSHPSADWHGLDVVASVDAAAQLSAYVEKSDGTLRFTLASPFVPVEKDGYLITPLKANHGTANPLIYLIQKDGRTLLYAHDTDTFPDETYGYLLNNGIRIDLLSLDCTEGAMESLPYEGHLCLGTATALRARMERDGLLTGSSVTVLNHFSHNGLNAVYDDFLPLAQREGFLVSYDGMEITV